MYLFFVIDTVFIVPPVPGTGKSELVGSHVPSHPGKALRHLTFCDLVSMHVPPDTPHDRCPDSLFTVLHVGTVKQR